MSPLLESFDTQSPSSWQSLYATLHRIAPSTPELCLVQKLDVAEKHINHTKLAYRHIVSDRRRT